MLITKIANFTLGDSFYYFILIVLDMEEAFGRSTTYFIFAAICFAGNPLQFKVKHEI